MDSYEKKYKELVGKIRKAYLYAQTDSTRAVLEDIFPELAKSEDERIRKSIIENLKGNMCRTDGDYDLLNKQIAWLEKQGEQKFAEWSKEDEDITLQIEQIMKCASFLNIVPEKLNKINKWLKSLKQRIIE
jgi:hypothetical protein